MGLLLAGCGEDPVKPAAAAAAPVKQGIDVTRAAGDVRTLLAATREVLPVPHRVVGTSTTKVHRGGELLDEISDETVVERAGDGALRAASASSRNAGRELVSAGGVVWVRPRYGKFHRRPPAEKGEAERVAREIAGTFAAELELVAGGLEARDGGATTFAGRAARKILLARGAGGAPRVTHAGAQAWRDSVSVEVLDGELILDAASGALLLGRLAARAGFVRGGERLEITVAATHEVKSVGAVTVTPPPDDESVDTPGRSTEFEDREALLQGLAPPARKAPTPKGTP